MVEEILTIICSAVQKLDIETSTDETKVKRQQNLGECASREVNESKERPTRVRRSSRNINEKNTLLK